MPNPDQMLVDIIRSEALPVFEFQLVLSDVMDDYLGQKLTVETLEKMERSLADRFVEQGWDIDFVVRI